MVWGEVAAVRLKKSKRIVVRVVKFLLTPSCVHNTLDTGTSSR